MDTAVTNPYPIVPAQRISWGAVFGGAVLSVGIWILLEVLGFAIGLSVAHPARGSLRGIGIGAGIWTLIAPLIALFIGGLVAGRLAGFIDRFGGALHGGVMWALTMIFGVLLLGSLGRAMLNGIGGAANAVEELKANATTAAYQTGHALFWIFGALLLALICSVLGATAGVSRRQVAVVERSVYPTTAPQPVVVPPPPPETHRP